MMWGSRMMITRSMPCRACNACIDVTYDRMKYVHPVAKVSVQSWHVTLTHIPGCFGVTDVNPVAITDNHDHRPHTQHTALSSGAITQYSYPRHTHTHTIWLKVSILVSHLPNLTRTTWMGIRLKLFADKIIRRVCRLLMIQQHVDDYSSWWLRPE